MGWFSDFVSDPIGTVADTAGDVLGGAVGAVRGVTGGLAGGIEDITGLNLSDPATMAALGLAAYGYMNPEMFGAAGATEAEALSGLDLGGAGASPATWGSTLGETSMGQAGNIAAGASTGTGISSGGYLGAQATPGTFASTTSPLGYGTGSVGIGAPAEGFFAGATPAAAAEPWSLSSLGNTVASGAKDVGNYIMNNKLQSAMIGSSLYDMYAKNQMANQLKKQREDQINQINAFYAPGSPEYNRLMQESQRQAAAAGRPFSNEQFQAEVAGKIADRKMQALNQSQQGSNQLLAGQLGNQYGGLNTLFNNLAMYQILQQRGMIR